ncbi:MULTISPECIES: NAD(P)H-dependent oxidoreductase [unclassified Cellulophaga]|uniref:NAD(P)H-dependent oxidoreductase n=1 Tax=unclassified Cellulophaga TaxID=2634405 RepID=UPI000C2CD4FB|nr:MULTISPECIES: NAD(P)H-dependent oxidoreductase [unclassified Cellulophaga]MDO6491645.1 NAD(P)H-dependent oxidoreductase [Cellulophaga sp. 2_MG-2023]MDO6493522.1 NAD(P)H-dependent oxidoreductase [Cellulophaga sp. 3_MG-2023]PKB44493.1 nitroreductase [Cellulophaga sp. RHA19]
MEYIKNLKWRYATKKFDSTKRVSQEHLNQLKEAIKLTPSSYGLQLYKVIIIEKAELKKRLKIASWNQDQVTDASHLIVFCNYTSVSDQNINDFIKRTAETQGIDATSLNNYGDFIKEKLKEMTVSEVFNWTFRQTYLGLGILLSACAELKIDSCPMEGFESKKYNDILELSEQGLNAAVIATIGYRSSEDYTQNRLKVRKSFNQLFQVI